MGRDMVINCLATFVEKVLTNSPTNSLTILLSQWNYLAPLNKSIHHKCVVGLFSGLSTLFLDLYNCHYTNKTVNCCSVGKFLNQVGFGRFYYIHLGVNLSVFFFNLGIIGSVN